MPTISAVSTKKKSSFFGGLFTKEPTLTALAQVEADLKAKHGAATPQKVPHVSSRKIPDHVPKVNSKWDGIPEAVKAREREEKQRRRMSQRNSLLQPPTAASQSSEGMNRRDPDSQRKGSEARSNDEFWQSQEGRFTATQATNSVSSGESRRSSIRGPRSTCSQSLRSPSGTSLPEITSFFPHHDKHTPATAPQRWQSVDSMSTQTTKSSSDRSKSDMSSNRDFGSLVDVIPEHSSSPITTPRELSPVTPSNPLRLQVAYNTEKQVVSNIEKQVTSVKDFSKPHVQRPAKRVEPVAIDAFLAGEARPLELNDDDEKGEQPDLPFRRLEQPLVDRVKQDLAQRPDTSRQRLGVGANMVVRTEAAPWETEDPPLVPGRTASLTNTNAPRNRFPKKIALFK